MDGWMDGWTRDGECGGDPEGVAGVNLFVGSSLESSFLSPQAPLACVVVVVVVVFVVVVVVIVYYLDAL